MHAFSAADGFLNVLKEGVDEMIKHLANEPSAGLFFVQQHARASMPQLLTVKEGIAEKVHEVALHTEDMEDSICGMRSMAEYGLPIVDEMIKDISKSLLIMSKSQPKRGLIKNPSWGFDQATQSSLSMEGFPPSGTDHDGQQSGASGRYYLSAMFDSARRRAAGVRWPQPEKAARASEDTLPSNTSPQPPAAEVEGDGQLQDVEERLCTSHTSSMLGNYDEFKAAEQELKL